MDPEFAHSFSMKIFKIPILNLFIKNKINLPKNIFGLSFKNPIGIAAGFDKNAKYINQISSLGFGFMEIGTVTPLPQNGNKKPRLFRLISKKALINNMGFNNDGVDVVYNRLKNLKNKNIIIGGNIGKNRNTPNEKAVGDYIICFNKLFDVVDYFTINVSSPNTPRLRELQEPNSLFKILNSLQEINLKKENPKPILIKISPDLNIWQLYNILLVIKQTKINGVVVSNTTIKHNFGFGGLSGKTLFNRTLELVRFLKGNNFIIIASGGIFTGEDAKQMIDAGADLVQLYTGLIYEGPNIVKNIAKKL